VRTEDFKHGGFSILLVLALGFSMVLVAPLASPGDWVNDPEPGGTTIDVIAGEDFLIRHTLEWDEPEDGAYTITLGWYNYENKPEENLTFVSAEAYFTTGDNVGESIRADTTLSSAPYGTDTAWVLEVSCPTGDKDPRDGEFNVDIWMGAYGVGGVPHISGNHVIPWQFGGVIVIEPTMKSWNRDPITISVFGRGVSVTISPLEGSAEPWRTLTFTVTVTNTDSVFDNYILTVSDDAGWGATLAQNLLTIPAGENRTTTVSVTVPSDADENESTGIAVTASSQADLSVSDSDTCTARAAAVVGEEEGLPMTLIAIVVVVVVVVVVVALMLLRGRRAAPSWSG